MNLIPTLQKLYPEGSIGPGSGELRGECAVFCEQLADFGPVGNYYFQKKKYVQDNGIIAPNIDRVGGGFRIGDVVVTSDGTNWLGLGHGHLFFVAYMDDQYLYAAESNFKLDDRVHYGRRVAKNDPKIYGIIRKPLKLDLGVCNFNYDVFINNQPAWSLGFLDLLSQQVEQWTSGKLKINFFASQTDRQNWWYEDVYYPFDQTFCKVIAKSYFDFSIVPITFSRDNQPAHAVAFMVRPDQWQGEIFGKPSLNGVQEIAFCNMGTRPAQIQMSCSESTPSPWYENTKCSSHALVHELSHALHFLNGLNDTTHMFDNPDAKQLDLVFNDLDWNRVIANL